MDFGEVREVLDQECQFPADQSTILECVGEVPLDGVVDDTETVRTVLERAEETTYRSAGHVYETLAGTVSGAYVGRRRYDDRGGTRAIPHDRSTESV